MADLTAAEVAALVVELRDPPEHVLPGIAGRAAKAIEQLQRALLDAAERLALLDQVSPCEHTRKRGAVCRDCGWDAEAGAYIHHDADESMLRGLLVQAEEDMENVENRLALLEPIARFATRMCVVPRDSVDPISAWDWAYAQLRQRVGEMPEAERARLLDAKGGEK